MRKRLIIYLRHIVIGYILNLRQTRIKIEQHFILYKIQETSKANIFIQTPLFEKDFV